MEEEKQKQEEEKPEQENRNVFQKRNDLGLFPNISYIYNEDGTVNWRKMIPQEFLVPNQERTQETDISKLKDNEILILLAGIKYIASLRGFSSVSYSVESCSADYCCVKCSIDWISNFETEDRFVHFESIADAHAGNTDTRMGMNYLSSIAENRSFVRSVRNFLKINIVGKDEMKLCQGQLQDSQEETSSPSPKSMMLDLMNDKNISFDIVKSKLIQSGFLEAQDYESVDDIPSSKLFELIPALKKAKKRE